MTSIKHKRFTTIRYDVIYNVEWRTGRKHSSIFVAKITNGEGGIAKAVTKIEIKQ